MVQQVNRQLQFKVKPVVRQVHFIGARSAFVILFTGLFTGMVLGLQGYYTLRKFGSEGFLGSAVALSLIRELGPVLTALRLGSTRKRPWPFFDSPVRRPASAFQSRTAFGHRCAASASAIPIMRPAARCATGSSAPGASGAIR